MTNKEKIHRLLTRALIEIRECAHENQPKVVFHLADLFHNLPGYLMTCTEEMQYGEALNFVRERSAQKGIEKWIDNALRDIADNAESDGQSD
jgi:hypothetical protein